MIAGIKKCIDEGDIKGLRYIFLDSLDIDPKRVLVPKAYTVELLEAFPEPQMQEAMIRNRETIKAFINKLESRQQC